jgi:hypothetical protein
MSFSCCTIVEMRVFARSCLTTLVCLALVGAGFLVGLAPGDEAKSTSMAVPAPNDDAISYGQKPLDYSGPDTADPVAALDRRLEAGAVRFESRSEQGYLRDVLAALDVPLESQVLVFSKSSANVRLVSPKTPRAIYFNDDVYVAWIPKAAALEISAVDPQKGAIFYTLPQAGRTPPRFQREGSCLLCHASTSALRVPGHLVRSFTTNDDGELRSGYSRITHDSPLAQRWGGWYVTGTHGAQPHSGNLIGEHAAERHKADPAVGGNVTDLQPYFDVAKYPAPHSDIVALLVLDHQAHLQNLLTRLNYETRLERRSTVLEPLVRYLLFADALDWDAPIRGTSGFAEVFAKRGPFDRRGRSLRELDLQTRLSKYRLSYLIYSRSVAALPDEAKSKLYRRLWDVLTGRDTSPPFRHLPAEERQAIVEILRETHPDLPEYWKTP